MLCPFCKSSDSQVKDSRPSEDGCVIRRRRQCDNCQARFTTYERVHIRDLNVIKNNGRILPFDRDKLVKSMQIALRKRDIDINEVEKNVSEIVATLEKLGESTISTKKIGKLVLSKLAKIDRVAYVRYASVYMEFTDIHDFEKFLGKLT